MPVIERPPSHALFLRLLRGEIPASVYVAQLRREARERVEELRRAR